MNYTYTSLPTTVVQGNSGGNSWFSMSNAKLKDGTYAYAGMSKTFDATSLILSGDYTLRLPDEAIISGIEIKVKKYSSGGSVYDYAIAFYEKALVEYNETPYYEELTGNKSLGTIWPTTATEFTYGSPTDNWGLTVADINNERLAFGLRAVENSDDSFTAYVDYIEFIVYYEVNMSHFHTSSTTTQDLTVNGNFKAFNLTNDDIDADGDQSLVTKKYFNDYETTKIRKIISQGAYYNTAVLTEDNRILVWGTTSYSNMGMPNPFTSKIPLEIQFPAGAGGDNPVIKDAVSYTYDHFVLFENGEMWVWGRNLYGALGLNHTTAQVSPILSRTLVKRLIPQRNLTYHIDGVMMWYESYNGNYYRAGYNAYGQLANGSVTNSSEFLSLPLGSEPYRCDVYPCSGGYGTSFKHDFGINKTYAVGLNNYGALGINSTTNQSNWTEITTLAGKSIKHITSSLGWYNTQAYSQGCTFFLTNGGEVWFAGYNGYSQNHTGNTTQLNAATRIYDPEAFITNTYSNEPTDTFWVPGGEYMVTVGTQDRYVAQYKLDEFYDLGHGTSFNEYIDLLFVMTDPTSAAFNGDGSTFMILSLLGEIIHSDLTTHFTLGTGVIDDTKEYSCTQDDQCMAMRFSPDGLKMFLLGAQFDTVFTYTLSTAWDITTLTNIASQKSVAGETTSPAGMEFNPTGDIMYIMESTTETIFQYTLSTPWDVSTATLFQSNDITGPVAHTATGIGLDETGKFLLKSCKDNDNIYQYTLETPWDISTAVFGIPVTKVHQVGQLGSFLQTDLGYYKAGYNAHGQMHNGSTATQTTSVYTPVSDRKFKIWTFTQGHTYSYQTAVFFLIDGVLFSSGEGSNGQCGDGAVGDNITLTKVLIDNPEKIVQIEQNGFGAATLYYHILFEDGSLWALGYGGRSNIGNGEAHNCFVPQRVFLK